MDNVKEAQIYLSNLIKQNSKAKIEIERKPDKNLQSINKNLIFSSTNKNLDNINDEDLNSLYEKRPDYPDKNSKFKDNKNYLYN